MGVTPLVLIILLVFLSHGWGHEEFPFGIMDQQCTMEDASIEVTETILTRGGPAMPLPVEMDLPTGLIVDSEVVVDFVTMERETWGLHVAIAGLFGDYPYHLEVDRNRSLCLKGDYLNSQWRNGGVINPCVVPNGVHTLAVRLTSNYEYEAILDGTVLARRPHFPVLYPPAANTKVMVWCSGGSSFCVVLRKVLARRIPKENVFAFGSLLPPSAPARQPTGQRPRVFVGIPTHPKNADRRGDIRASYLRHPAFRSGEWVARFFAGTASNPRDNELLAVEASLWDDIIIDPSLEESYRNIVHKSLAIFRHGGEVVQADFVFKADDDTFINVERMIEFLAGRESRYQYIGKIAPAAGPIRVPENKWYMPYDLWPKSSYPPFAFGSGYLVSRQIANGITKGHRSGDFNMIHLEDVAVGIWIDGLKTRGVEPEYVHSPLFPSIGCVAGGYIAHNVDHNHMKCMWDKIRTLQAAGEPAASQDYCCSD